MELRDEIQAYLERTGKRQRALAEEAGVQPSLICRILSGKQSDVAGRNLRKIEQVLNEAQHG